jgi:uncharacterized protein
LKKLEYRKVNNVVKSISLYKYNDLQINNLINTLNETVQADERILFAYLHGSVAEKRDYRDIDLAIYLKELPKKDMFDIEMELEEKLQAKIAFPVDLKVLNLAPAHFRYMAIKKGIKLYIRDDSKRTAFEMHTLQEYFDFLPYRQRYLREA